jgi:outer membrane protein TolC
MIPPPRPPAPRPLRGALILPLLASLLAGTLAAEEQLTLEQALATAQRANENAAIARERMIQAQGAVREAYAELLPRITVTGSYTPVSDHSGEYLQGVATVDLTLLDPTALPRLDRASRLRDAQQLDADELRRALAFDTANGFYLVLAASRLVSAAERRLGVADEALRQARLRADAGLVERSAVTRSELESATARTELIRARNGALRARFALAYLLGTQPADMQPATRWPTLVEPAPAVDHGTAFPALLQEAARQRGDVRALDARAEAARFEAREPLASTLPRLALHGEADYLRERSRSPDPTDWRASLVATWDL